MWYWPIFSKRNLNYAPLSYWYFWTLNRCTKWYNLYFGQLSSWKIFRVVFILLFAILDSNGRNNCCIHYKDVCILRWMAVVSIESEVSMTAVNWKVWTQGISNDFFEYCAACVSHFWAEYTTKLCNNCCFKETYTHGVACFKADWNYGKVQPL
jgi:hypothetical protein